MAENIDPALTGAAFDLANAGYTSMPEEKPKQKQEIGSDNASLREAAEKRSGSRDEVVVRKYTDAEGKPAASNEAVTLARAARDYAGAVAAEKLIGENESSRALAARIDAFRAEALANDPDAAEFYGFDPPESGDQRTGEADKAEPEGEESQDQLNEVAQDRSTEQLDSELAKALQHPQVLQAIEEKVGEAERARQSYRQGLDAATQIARASFLSQFPELASVAPEGLPAALQQMSRQDPAKFARVQALVATTEHLFAQQAQQNRHQAESARRNFARFAQAEDARIETMLKGEPKETQQAVLAEIIASAKASGIEPDALNRLFNSEPLMRNATFQRMMYDAGKYRLMMKAKNAALAKPVPPVQRPGMATTRSERDRADLRTLSAKLSSSGDLRDAVALYKARMSAK